MPDLLAHARPPLGGREGGSELAVALTEAPLTGMITLRGDLTSAALAQAVTAATGGALPAVRRVEASGDRAACWMSPDELLLIVPYVEADAIVERLSQDLSGEHHLAVNVSDARAIIHLTGDGSREVLAKGAPADLSPGAFGLGDLRRTRIEQIAAAFWMTGERPDAFTVVCFRSYGEHLWRWLEASARQGALPGAL